MYHVHFDYVVHTYKNRLKNEIIIHFLMMVPCIISAHLVLFEYKMLLSTSNRLTSTLVVQFHNTYVPAHDFFGTYYICPNVSYIYNYNCHNIIILKSVNLIGQERPSAHIDLYSFSFFNEWYS